MIQLDKTKLDERTARLDLAQRIATNGIPSAPRGALLRLMRDQTGTVTAEQIDEAAAQVIAEHEASFPAGGTVAENSERAVARQNAREAQERAELDHAKACDDKRDTADSLTEERLRGLLRQAEQFIAGFEDDPMQEGISELLAAIRAEIE